MRPFLLLLTLFALPASAQQRPLLAAGHDVLAGDIAYSLQHDVLAPWYPRSVDSTQGGFLSRFDYRWNPVGDQQKMIVTQARHVWTNAQAARLFPDAADAHLAMAAHGAAFLRGALWDDVHGGFFWLVARDGTPLPEADGQLVKQAYGNAFGIYALAAYHAASGDTAALHLAQDAFRWLDAHAHDPARGGYFNYLLRDGTPLTGGYAGTPPKDQNSSIHLLEAFTELYHVWPDQLLRERLSEMLTLVRDTITVAPGTLTLFSTADWQPISYRDSTADVREAHRYFDHVSFGHDVETAYLMLEAAEALGLDPAPTLRAGKTMVDHALKTGWDDAVGGFYEAGYYLRGDTALTVLDSTKNWWAQAEGLNTLYLMGQLFPDDPARYHDRFLQLWAYTQAYLVDHQYGGWYAGGLDMQPELRTADKGHIWKASYHDARALMNLVRHLREAP